MHTKEYDESYLKRRLRIMADGLRDARAENAALKAKLERVCEWTQRFSDVLHGRIITSPGVMFGMEQELNTILDGTDTGKGEE